MKPIWGWLNDKYCQSIDPFIGVVNCCVVTRIQKFWLSRLYVMQDGPYRRVSLSYAIRSPDPAGRWWCNSRGYLERPLTLYEALRLDEGPPIEGWMALSCAETWKRSGEQQDLPKQVTETEQLALVKAEKLREFKRLRNRYYYWRNTLNSCSPNSTRFNYVQKQMIHFDVEARKALQAATDIL